MAFLRSRGVGSRDGNRTGDRGGAQGMEDKKEQMTDPMIYYTFEGRDVGFGHRAVGVLRRGKKGEFRRAKAAHE